VGGDMRIVSVCLKIHGWPYGWLMRTRHGRREVYEKYNAVTLSEFVQQLICALERLKPGLMKDMVELDAQDFQASRHRKRRYIAIDKGELYPESPNLPKKFACPIGGDWIESNRSARQARAVAHLACRAAGVEYQSVRRLELSAS